MAATTNQQSASVIITDDPRTRAKALLFRHVPWRRHQDRPSFPHRLRRAPARSGSLPQIHQAREATTSISIGSIKRPQRRSRGREAEISASFSNYKMKKRLYRDLAKRGPGRASSEEKHLVA